MNGKSCLALLLFALSTPLAAQQVHWWTEDFEAALTRAEERNVPLIIVYIQDGEEASDRLEKALFESKEFVQMANEIVPIVANHTIHKPRKARVTGPNRSVCAKFGYCTCTQHKRLEFAARGEFWPSGQVKTPSVIVFKPDLDEVERLIDVHDVSDYLRAIKKGRGAMGPGLDEKQLAVWTKARSRIEGALDRSDLAGAVQHFRALSTLPQVPQIKKRIVRYRERIAETHARYMKEIDQRFSAGEALAVLRELGTIEEALGKTSFARDIAKVRGRFERTKEGRKAKKILRSEARALPKLEDAREAWGKRNYRKAVKNWFYVLDRVPGGPLHEEAKKSLEELGKDEALARICKEDLDEGWADFLFEQARALRSSDPKRYSTLLKQIVERYPGTKGAARAAKALG